MINNYIEVVSGVLDGGKTMICKFIRECLDLKLWIGFLLPCLIKWVVVNIKKIEIKRKMSKRQESLTAHNILTLDSAIPSYNHDDISIVAGEECFFLSIPEKKLQEIHMIDANYPSRNEAIFNSTIDILGENMGIADLSELIAKHRITVADKILESFKNGNAIYNNEKWGVRNIIRSRSNHTNESNTMRMRLYKTDYYTHRVMKEVYRELREKGALISQVKEINEINRYYPFLTSFGVNSLVVLDDEEFGDLIVVTKRSKHTANMDKAKWHVSMNEGLCMLDGHRKDVSLSKCLMRGLEEELGVTREFYNEFRDFFLVMDTFEMGITSLTRIAMDKQSFQIGYEGAKDRALESLQTEYIIEDNKEIKKFIKENNEMTSIAKYSLLMHISRRR